MATQTTPEQLGAFVNRAPANGPLTMLNLLKFRPRAAYADGRETALTGADAYGIYGTGVTRMIYRLGGKMVFAGAANAQLIGDDDLPWDMVIIMEYPSLQAFLNMIASDEYQALQVHREAGLEHQVLINCLTGQQVSQERERRQAPA